MWRWERALCRRVLTDSWRCYDYSHKQGRQTYHRMTPRCFIGLVVSDEASKNAPLVYYAVGAGRYRNGGLYGTNRHNRVTLGTGSGKAMLIVTCWWRVYAGEILDVLVSWTYWVRGEVEAEVRRGRSDDPHNSTLPFLAGNTEYRIVSVLCEKRGLCMIRTFLCHPKYHWRTQSIRQHHISQAPQMDHRSFFSCP